LHRGLNTYEIINDSFERIWPDLEKNFNSIKDMASETKVPARELSDMVQELLELVREQSRVNLERRVNTNQQERAEIIIKILKEGLYGSLGDILGSSTFSGDPFGQLHNKVTRERLENELLDMTLRER
jgi:hypothetical protein